MKVAVVGCGIGQFHIEAYQKLPEKFEVVAICDLDQEKATATAAKFGIGHVFTSFDELCAWDEVEVIDICTPSHLHVPNSHHALAAGKHVICEKPIAGSLLDIDGLMVAEQVSGKRLMPIFNYRFGHGLQKLLHLRAKGVTGNAYLSSIEVHWLRGAPYYAVDWRGKWVSELGGCLITHAIHAHDALYQVLGPAKSVFARTKTLVNPIETEDCVVLSLEMADGSLVTSSVTLGSAVEITRQRYCFEHLTVESNLAPYAENTANPWHFTPQSDEAKTAVSAALADFVPQPEGYEGQFSRFYDAMQTGGPLPVTLQDAWESAALLTAVYHSARTNQPVELPIDRAHPLYAGWQP
ncbi:MAG: Gfo/Idh/MocA family oxidoreductase [Chloroflexota bacterium]